MINGVYHISVTPPLFISLLIIKSFIFIQSSRTSRSLLWESIEIWPLWPLVPKLFACRLLTTPIVCCINTCVNVIVCMSKVWQFDASLQGNWNKPTLFCSFHFSQKRAKKIEGDSIYIRHSLLMLEVCIPSGEASLWLHFLALWHTGCCLISRLHVARFTLFASAFNDCL